MATKAQTKANQQNAQKSTGPQTDEGKATVSQNAVKHGLFAAEAVIKGEDPAEYQAYHDQFLAELDPVGAVETMLADRFVSLVWRLKRAERMQNQAIDSMIENQIDNPMAKRFNMIKCHAKGIKLGDPRYVIGHLQLGRIGTSDWSDSRVLDRMMLYERRIESSMTKMMNELKRQQIMRRIEHEDDDGQEYEPSPSLRDEAATRKVEQQVDLKKQNQSRPSAGNPKSEYLNPKQVKKDAILKKQNQSRSSAGNPKSEYLNPKRVKKDAILKKQSQFAPELIGTTPFVKGDYENKSAGRIEENKAKQSQFLAHEQTKRVGKRDKSVVAATG